MWTIVFHLDQHQKQEPKDLLHAPSFILFPPPAQILEHSRPAPENRKVKGGAGLIRCLVSSACVALAYCIVWARARFSLRCGVRLSGLPPTQVPSPGPQPSCSVGHWGSFVWLDPCSRPSLSCTSIRVSPWSSTVGRSASPLMAVRSSDFTTTTTTTHVI